MRNAVRDNIIQIRVTDEEKQTLTKIAEERGETLSDYVRRTAGTDFGPIELPEHIVDRLANGPCEVDALVQELQTNLGYQENHITRALDILLSQGGVLQREKGWVEHPLWHLAGAALYDLERAKPADRTKVFFGVLCAVRDHYSR